MRPLTAIGEVQRRTLLQVPVPPPKTIAPVSPSAPMRLPPAMYQRIVSLVPSVDVVMGAVLVLPGAQNAVVDVGGAPGLMRIDMTLPPLLLGQIAAPAE